ncbi:hypothetical protein C8N43_2083 [Litoreibacter ponti]|uniref:Hemolysin type calcium-binding protein n=1 Tax=Litoreibacter ponti TaxID=1510457 RepID=A0A2T6BMY1_9RHOB|nr:calcium-binding protein [Litoreibacter ponti]PTX57416.1 hypothetical protein C8N43_2083 [Litoreibacter ponti]
MTIYRVIDSQISGNHQISEEMFGLNFVTTFDYDFASNEDAISRLSELQPSVLRFPGGSATEYAFADGAFSTGDWEATSLPGEFGVQKVGTPLSQYFEIAGQINAEAQLVIPTRVAFVQSAGQALMEGTYGARQELTSEYFENVIAFIEQSLVEAAANSVTISRFELGNEFWGSGEMTASEYGFLASRLATFLNDRYPDVELLTQVTSSSNRFSQRNDTSVYLEPDGRGDFNVWLASEVGEDVPDGWIVREMPGQGNAAEQTRDIADQILAHPGALDAISGILEHVYFEDGFAGIDEERNYSLYSIYNRFIEQVGVDEIDYYITEWSPRNPRNSNDDLNLGNANGLHLAHTTIEAFFELASAGVDGANFWPLTFGNPRAQDRTLIDTEENDLTFSGVAFQWLRESTLGMETQADYEVAGEIDIHTFRGEDTYTLFVGERSGVDRLLESDSAIQLDFQDVVSSGEYVVRASILGTDGAVDIVETDPIIREFVPFSWSGGLFSLELGAWELARIELISVSDPSLREFDPQADLVLTATLDQENIYGGAGHDLIIGDDRANSLYSYGGDDEIYAGGGDDVIHSGAGSDTIHVQEGRNTVFSGEGNDIVFAGSSVGDYVGGLGSDHISFEDSDAPVVILTYSLSMQDFLDPSGFGSDLGYLHGFEALTTTNHGDYVAHIPDAEALFLGLGDDISHRNGGIGTEVFGEGGDDIIQLAPGSYGFGGDGDDEIWTAEGDEFVYGGSGDDQFLIYFGDDFISTGSGNDTVSIQSNGHSDDFTISDFDPEHDSINFFDEYTVNQLVESGFADATQIGDDMVLEAENGWRVTLLDVNLDESFFG